MDHASRTKSRRERKADLPPVPDSLADLALIDGKAAAAAGSMAYRSWLDAVKRGDAPQPVVKANRMTRWRLADVRAWLADVANRGSLKRPTA